MIILVWLAGLLPISVLGLWFWEKVKLFKQKQRASKTAAEGLAQKEKEVAEVEGPLEFLKEAFLQKEIARKFAGVGKEGEPWIAGKSPERRKFLRLDLNKDYNRTIILRIKSTDKSKCIKSFVKNIGLEGMCFETGHELNEKEKLSGQLFFFWDKVSMSRIQTRVIWNKFDTGTNCYGVSFTCQEEKDKMKLARYYIESNLPER